MSVAQVSRLFANGLEEPWAGHPVAGNWLAYVRHMLRGGPASQPWGPVAAVRVRLFGGQLVIIRPRAPVTP